MGQRFQIYVRYNGGESLQAIHLQWSWGFYSIVRAAQLIDFIQENMDYIYSPFKLNSICHEDAKDIIFGLSSLNLTSKSYVKSIDLVQEKFEYSKDDNRERECKRMG
jgi:hypothetical protein